LNFLSSGDGQSRMREYGLVRATLQ
jgi:hypothetical protein